ncbi:MFS transporter [Enterococcus thailandicus]|uniref:MFS transporter n=1 Tax=Enterococcus thailandicus TaxID=417368 RepID=UPI0022EBD316|nr:MFS transporter [Enterococcus thailandicus]MDA3972762.1 MFS transporter [Enterococcus thailandicus]MDA3975258.1 MFS transporter [Enterococcus thailandicus]MDA3980222.1 MFS transporter [Enterococcus thailandicus]
MSKETLKKVSILAISFIVVSVGAIGGNIPEIAKSFPNVPMTMIENLVTIPALFIIPSVLLSNTIAKHLGYKNTVLLGLALVFFAGVAPALIESFPVIFIARCIFGFGIGMFNSLIVGFISYFYSGNERAKLIGFQSAFEGIGGMSITFLVGQLLRFGWQASFWVYALALPMLLLFALFVPDVSYDEMINRNKKGVSSQKINENQNNTSLLGVIGYIALLFVGVNIYMSTNVKATALMSTLGYGDATDGSTIISVVGIGAMSAGFLFGKTLNLLKKYIVPVSFSFMGLALLIMGLSNSVLVTALGAILCGFSFRTFIPYLFNKVNSSPSINPGLATSLLLVGFNLGSAFSPYGIAIIERLNIFGSIRGIFYTEAIILFVFAIVGLVFISISSMKGKELNILNNQE